MWHTMSTGDCLAKLGVDAAAGLGQAEAEERLKANGRNALAEKKKRPLILLFLLQFKDALIYVLIAAAIVSALMGEVSDAAIIMAVIIINAIVGVVQESKAEKSLEALKRMSAPKALVRRGGQTQEIASELLVPGDIVVIEAGRVIPCDLRWIESANLKVDESALTGESLPSEKNAQSLSAADSPLGDRLGMGFMSTVATYGRGLGLAVATGMGTEIGKIAGLLSSQAEESTPLQKKLESFGKRLGLGILLLCAFILAVETVQEFVHLGQWAAIFQKGPKGVPFLEFFLTAISLAVAAIPEGLAAIVAIVLAIGVQKMIKRNAIVRKLPSVETLGAVTLICSDKTGTLTQNRMTVVKSWTSSGFLNQEGLDGSRGLIETLCLCSDASYSPEGQSGDPTEIALVEAAWKIGSPKEALDERMPRIAELPFDSDRKLMSTVHASGDQDLVAVKGAPDVLLARCVSIDGPNGPIPLGQAQIDAVKAAMADMSAQALRVLGAAYKRLPRNAAKLDDLESGLCFQGLVGMIDPPRLEVKDSIATCRAAGIDVAMITGDHKDTALAIAAILGIRADSALSGPEIDALDEEALRRRAETTRVFARVSPEHKVRIVKAFKANGHVCSMTGDGVNDAPSLKAADIGVAMGITGTDVAKGAADMVLTDDNFSTIVHAVEEGRNIYANIRKAILYLLSCNSGEIISIFGSIVAGWGSPLLPIHILWVNLVTDTLPALSLGMDPGDPDIIKEKPRDPKESLFARGGSQMVALGGALIGLITLLAYRLGIHLSADRGQEASMALGRSMAFAVLGMSQLFHSFNLRHRTRSVFSRRLSPNLWLLGSFFVAGALQLCVLIIPALNGVFKVSQLSLSQWLIVLGISAFPLLAMEVLKLVRRLFRRA